MSSRKEGIGAMIGLVASVIIVAGVVFFFVYTDGNAYSQRIHRLTAEKDLEGLLQIADTGLRHSARVQAASAAGKLVATTARRDEIEARFVAGRDRVNAHLDAEVYRAGLESLNADLIGSFLKQTRARAGALIGTRANGEDQGRRSPEGFPKLEPGTRVDMILHEGLPESLRGRSRVEINATIATTNRIGLVFNADRAVGFYVGSLECGNQHSAILVVRDLYLIDLTAQSVTGAARVEGSRPPQTIGVKLGECRGETGSRPDLAGWFVLPK